LTFQTLPNNESSAQNSSRFPQAIVLFGYYFLVAGLPLLLIAAAALCWAKSKVVRGALLRLLAPLFYCLDSKCVRKKRNAKAENIVYKRL
jgi:hypothetical protein